MLSFLYVIAYITYVFALLILLCLLCVNKLAFYLVTVYVDESKVSDGFYILITVTYLDRQQYERRLEMFFLGGLQGLVWY